MKNKTPWYDKPFLIYFFLAFYITWGITLIVDVILIPLFEKIF